MGSINWSEYIKQAEEAGESVKEYTPLPADSYDAKVLEAEAVKTKKEPVRDMIKITWVIDGGPHSGRRVWSNLVIDPANLKGFAITVRQLQTLGAGALLDSNASVEQVAASLKDSLATIKVTEGEWNGKPKNDVKNIAARQGSAVPNISSPASSMGTGSDLPI